jgi:hypothetical protein
MPEMDSFTAAHFNTFCFFQANGISLCMWSFARLIVPFKTEEKAVMEGGQSLRL